MSHPNEPEHWSADGGRITLEAQDPAPWLSGPVMLGVLGVLFVVGVIVFDLQPGQHPGDGTVPETCLEAPWACPVDPTTQPTSTPFDGGIQPDVLERAILALAAQGPPNDSPQWGMCMDMLRGISRGTDPYAQCVPFITKQVKAGALVVPSQAMPSFNGHMASDWRSQHERRLRREWQRLHQEWKTQAHAPALAAWNRRDKASRIGTIYWSVATAVTVCFLVFMTVFRLLWRRPVRVQIDPRGLTIDDFTFPRDSLAKVVVDTHITVELPNGKTWTSRSIQQRPRRLLREHLDSLLLDPITRSQERAGRMEAAALLQAARPRNGLGESEKH